MTRRRKTLPQAAALRAAYQQDLSSFVHGAFRELNPGEAFVPTWHVDAVCWSLTKVKRGVTKRLVVTLPPRHLKSFCGSVAFAAWALGHDPSTKIVVVSYGEALSHMLHQQFRALVTSDFYRKVFPNVKARFDTLDNFITTQGGGRRAMSVGGALTGFGADIIIVDDPMKAIDAARSSERERLKSFFDNTLYSRLNSKRDGRIVVIAQRLHEDDLPGFLLNKGGYAHLNLPGIAEEDGAFEVGPGRIHHRRRGDILCPERESAETLEQIRLEMGAPAFDLQVQQHDRPSRSDLLRWERIVTFDAPPEREECQFVVQSWDPAVTGMPGSDFSACTTWGLHERVWKLLDVQRLRMDYTDLLDVARAHRAAWTPEIVITERVGAGIPFFAELRRDARANAVRGSSTNWIVIDCRPRGDKETRFAAHAAKLQSGQFQFPKTASWLAELKSEMIGFPQGRYDDQVDSVIQFIEWAPRSTGLQRSFAESRRDDPSARRAAREEDERPGYRRRGGGTYI